MPARPDPPPVFPPVEIGAEARPPTVVTPDPATLFARRARRFRDLAPDHKLAPWLLFLADLTQAQHEIQPGLPGPLLPDLDAIERSIEFGMPVLPRMPFVPDPAVTETIFRLLDRADRIAMPDPARAALTRLWDAAEHDGDAPIRSTQDLTIRAHVDAVLSDSIPVESLAEHVFIGAALQVHFTRAAALLDARSLRFIGDRVCPVCGAAPASSSIVGWGETERTRFCPCSLCATRWNAVRVKCLACSSTKGIHYQSIEGLADTIKAECCDE